MLKMLMRPLPMSEWKYWIFGRSSSKNKYLDGILNHNIENNKHFYFEINVHDKILNHKITLIIF